MLHFQIYYSEELTFWRYTIYLPFTDISIRILSFDYVIFMDANNHPFGGFISNSSITEA